MPRIYGQRRDEIYIRTNIMPAKDGSEPGALRSVIFGVCVGLLVLVGASGWLVNHFVLPVPNAEITSVLYLFWCILALYITLFTAFFRKELIFSRSAQAVYSGWILRKHVGDFNEFSCIGIFESGKHLWFGLLRRDRFEQPVRISPIVKDRRRLALYYHEIVPLLSEVSGLPFISEGELPPDTVPVSDSPTPPPLPVAVEGPEAEEMPRYRFFVYKPRTGLYYERFGWGHVIGGGGLLVVFGVWTAFILFTSIIPQIAACIGLAGYLASMWNTGIAFRLDPRRRTMICYTHFGLKKVERTADDIRQVISVGALGIYSLAVHFKEGSPKFIGPVDAFSTNDLRLGMLEFGKILGTDMTPWL